VPSRVLTVCGGLFYCLNRSSFRCGLSLPPPSASVRIGSSSPPKEPRTRVSSEGFTCTSPTTRLLLEPVMWLPLLLPTLPVLAEGQCAVPSLRQCVGLELGLAMGSRTLRERQETLLCRDEIAEAPGHRFYEPLNAVLEEAGCDALRWSPEDRPTELAQGIEATGGSPSVEMSSILTEEMKRGYDSCGRVSPAPRYDDCSM
jgi:hypothetical protein